MAREGINFLMPESLTLKPGTQVIAFFINSQSRPFHQLIKKTEQKKNPKKNRANPTDSWTDIINKGEEETADEKKESESCLPPPYWLYNNRLISFANTLYFLHPREFCKRSVRSGRTQCGKQNRIPDIGSLG